MIEETSGASRSTLRFPEREGHSAPIELVCTIGLHRYALEHTRIEAFPNQIQDGVDFVNALEFIQDALVGKVPNDTYYQLSVHVGSLSGIKRREIPRIQERIVDWVIDRAATMARNPRGYVEETIDGVPFAVSLVANHWPVPGENSLAGKVRIARFAPNNLEALRVNRLKTALDRKLPKLRQWSREASTVLVLEENDIALTNHYLVIEALRQAAAARGDMPSMIFMVTFIGTDVLWAVRLWEGGQFVPHEDLLQLRHELRADALRDIFKT